MSPNKDNGQETDDEVITDTETDLTTDYDTDISELSYL